MEDLWWVKKKKKKQLKVKRSRQNRVYPGFIPPKTVTMRFGLMAALVGYVICLLLECTRFCPQKDQVYLFLAAALRKRSSENCVNLAQFSYGKLSRESTNKSPTRRSGFWIRSCALLLGAVAPGVKPNVLQPSANNNRRIWGNCVIVIHDTPVYAIAYMNYGVDWILRQ